MPTALRVARGVGPCDYGRVERAEGSTLGRVIACALLVLGIAAMHHVVVTGCAAFVSAQGHAHSVHVPDPSADAPADAIVDPVAGQHVDGLGDAPQGEMPAAAICLAILLGGWLLTPLIRAWRMRRGVEPFGRTHDRPVVDVPARPPDLVSLSISRT